MSGSSAGALAARLALDTSGFNAKMADAGALSEREMARIRKQVQFVTDYIRTMADAQKQANNGASMAKATQEITRTGQAAELSAKQMLRANQMLPAQITDIVTSLASGQQPWLVMIQQGGQIKDMFGGLGGAARALMAYLTPLNLAITAGASAVVALGVGYFQANEQVKAFNYGLVLTRNSAGQTAESMETLVSSVAKLAKESPGAARDVLQGLVSSGQVGPGQLAATAEAALKFARVSGNSAESVIKDFAGMRDGVLKWAVEHNKQLNFMTAAMYSQIKVAEDMGDKEAAIGVVLDALNNQLETNRSFWDKVKLAASEAWDAFVGNEKPKTVQENLANVDKMLAQLDKAARFRRGNPAFSSAPELRVESGQDPEALADQARLLRLSLARRETNALAAAEDARVQKAGIAGRTMVDKLLEETKTRDQLTRRIQEYSRAIADAAAAGKPYSQDEINAVMAQLRKQNRTEGDAFIEQLQRQVKEQTLGKDEMLRLEAAQKGVSKAAAPYIFQLSEIEARQQRIRRVVEETAESERQRSKVSGFLSAGDKAAKGYIEQGQEIGLTAKELERLNLARQLELELQTALTGADSVAAADIYMAEARNARLAGEALADLQAKRDAYKADGNNGATTVFRKWADDAADNAKRVETAITNAYGAMENAAINWLKTGKLGWREVFGSMAEEYLRAQMRMAAAKFSSNFMDKGGNFTGWGSVVSWIGGLFGGNSHAGGLDYVPYDGYPAILHKGEKVQTAVEAAATRSGTGKAMNFDFSGQVLNVGQGVSRAEMDAVVAKKNAELELRMRRLSREGVFG